MHSSDADQLLIDVFADNKLLRSQEIRLRTLVAVFAVLVSEKNIGPGFGPGSESKCISFDHSSPSTRKQEIAASALSYRTLSLLIALSLILVRRDF
jgi:hypothetical protein